MAHLPLRQGGGFGLTRRALLALPFLGSCAQACSRSRIAEMPLRLVDDYPVLPASLAGQPVSLLLDTGAQGMLVTPEIAQALALPLNGMTTIYGTGGSQQVRVVRLPGLRLGGAPMPDSLAPVAPLPVTVRMTPPLAGLLGASLLARFDLDLDVPGGRVTLWSPEECPPPLTGTRVPLDVSRAGEPFLPVQVNGQTLLALLDTGVRATLIDTAAARRLGLRAPVSANTARGVDGEPLPLEHVHARLALGDAPATETPISISPLQLERGEMLLGLDQMRQRRVWVGYARGEVIFAPRSPAP